MISIIAVYQARGINSGLVYEIVESEEMIEVNNPESRAWVASGYRSFSVKNHENRRTYPVYDANQSILRFMVEDEVTGVHEMAFILAPERRSGMSSVVIDDSGRHLPKTGSY